MILSQSGPKAGRAFTALPTGAETTIRPLRMNVLARRRLRLPLPLAPRRCNGPSCRTPLDAYGDHWAACSVSGRLVRRARPMERAWGRVLEEAGARVQRNQRLADMDIPGISASDGRIIELVANDLPSSANPHGLPLVCDVTMGSPLRANGTARPRAHAEPGVAIANAEQNKVRRYPELVDSTRCKFVVLACEVGGRWSATCCQFVRDLAEAKSRAAPRRLQRSTARAWEDRWSGMLAVAAQDALAATLVDVAPQLLHARDVSGPPLGMLLHGEAPAQSRLPLR